MLVRLKKLFYLMQTLIKLLTKKKIKISFAESCTGGLLASAVTSISGASKVFNLGLVTYSNQAKIKVLKINKRAFICPLRVLCTSLSTNSMKCFWLLNYFYS